MRKVDRSLQAGTARRSKTKDAAGGMSQEALKHDLKSYLRADCEATPAPFREIVGDIAGRPFRLTVFLADSFLHAVQKGRLTGDRNLYNALGNLRYGFDPAKAESPGGKDGIFAVSRDHRPRNEMMVKLYDRCFDTERGKKELKRYFDDVDAIQGVRVVCHGMRLLGFIEVRENHETLHETLVLVDLDVNRR